MKIEADTVSQVQEWLINACICVIVSGLGVLFLAGGLYMSYVKIHQLRLEPVPCEITQSTLYETRKGKQSLAVQFTYSWEGRSYVGEQRSGIVSTYLEDKAKCVAERLSVGTVDTCYVNPSNPEEVLLQRDDLPWYLVVLATFGGLIMGTFIVFMSLAELLRQTKTICFSAEFRNISKHSAISGLSCFVLAAFSLVSAIRVYREPDLWSVFNPWYLEVVCLGIMSLTLLKNRIWAVLFAVVWLLVAGAFAIQNSATVAFISFAAFRLWPMLRKKQAYPFFYPVNFTVMTLLLVVLLTSFYADNPLTAVDESVQGNWLPYGSCVVYFVLYGFYELFEPKGNPGR